MTKAENIADPNSCWNRAKDGERIFILLERDLATPATIRDWVVRRMQFGLNRYEDEQLQRALNEASEIERIQNASSPPTS